MPVIRNCAEEPRATRIMVVVQPAIVLPASFW
jgi:hypothetical protein